VYFLDKTKHTFSCIFGLKTNILGWIYSKCTCAVFA